MIKLFALLAILLAVPSAEPVSVPLDYACAYVETFYGAECSDIPAPTVVVTKLVQFPYYGVYYRGERFVFINSQIDAEMQAKVALHETVHYLLYWSGTEASRCESEEAARRLTALYYDEKYDPSWKTWYRCAK